MTKLPQSDEYSDINLMALRQDLVRENEFLTKLVDTIPAKMYFGHDIQEKITSEKHSVMDKKAAALKRSFNHVELSAKSKHKRARVDPLCQKNVSEIHEQMDGVKKKKIRIKKKGLLQPSASLTRAANIEELQKRLQERIKEFQSKRKGIGRANPTVSKKLRVKEKKMKQKTSRLSKEKQVLNPYKETQPKKEVKSNSSKPIYNEEGKIIYSKLDFSENGEEETKKSEFSGKNYKKLLQKAEKKKEKIENLKSTNPELADNLEEKERWKKAILKSENIKIKDDTNLLKKSIKNQEKIKKKKGKEWKERIENVESKKQKRQEKRSKNIKLKKKRKNWIVKLNIPRKRAE